MKSMRDENVHRQVDSMLSRALTQQVNPDVALQQRICSQWKERQTMNRNKKWMTAVAACACLLAVSVSVGAASRYLSLSLIHI